MSDFNSLVQYTVENISRPIKYIIYKLTEFIRVVDKFVFRQVPAGAASGYANIEKVEGNTVNFNQLFKGAGTGSYTLNGPSNYYGMVPNSNVSGNAVKVINGHKYYVSLIVERSITGNGGCSLLLGGGTYADAAGITFGIDDSFVNGFNSSISTAIATKTLTGIGYDNYSYARGFASGDYLTVSNINIIDLTAIFGAGNEPTTVAEFEAWMAQNIGTLPYYDYNAGELLSVKMQSVKSVGFNQWDEQWELGTLAQGQPSFASTRIRTKNYIPVIGGATYFFKFPWAKFVCSYDDNYNYLGNITITNNIAALDGQVKYLKWSSYTAGAITTYNNDICINLSDPSKNGTYEPYQSDSADIDVTTITGINTATNVREVIFADGMKQADREGTVKDTLDLRSDTATVNVGSRAYQSGDESDTSVITDGTTTYYALTTPIEYTDLQDANGNPLNPRYKVEQGGTEQVLPVNTSSPTTVAPTLTTTYNKNI